MILNSPRMQIGIGIAEKAHNNESKAGIKAANMALNNLNHKVIISKPIIKENKEWKNSMPYFMLMFSDSIKCNSAAIIRGASSVIGAGFPIVGGCAGDDFKFKKTYQCFVKVRENTGWIIY